jgi:single-stranded DNA-binding protein
MQMLDSRGDGGSMGGGNYERADQGGYGNAPSQGGSQGGYSNAPAPAADFDDDIPF